MGVKYVPLGKEQTLKQTDLAEGKETTMNPVQVSCKIHLFFYMKTAGIIPFPSKNKKHKVTAD